MADIADRLGALELENFEHKSFIPFSELKKLFTRDKVYELLRQYDIHFHLINETVDRVLDGGLRTFAVLGAVQDIGSITRFIKEDQFSGVSLDARLPLQGTDISRYFSNPEKGKLFLRRQWSFLAPVFSENRSCRKLDDRIILPFLHKKLVDKGGFGKVYRISVDVMDQARNWCTQTLSKDNLSSVRGALSQCKCNRQGTGNLGIVQHARMSPSVET